jgi:glyoxylase-like metal-dependent hydrolase (beta-lactamase superfamily II)
VCSFKAGLSVVHAIETDSGIFLIDAGTPGQGKKILKRLKTFSPKPLSMIIITHAHFDHYGSALELRNMTGAKIAIHEVDAPDMAQGKTKIDLVRSWGIAGKFILPLVEVITKPAHTTADILLHDKDNLSSYGLPATVLHTPGHTIGSVSILLPDSTAFVSDLLIVNPSLNSQCYYANSWSEIAKSLALLQSIKPKLVFTGHSTKAVRLKNLLRLVPVKG